jgi:hypothetical protein
MSHRIETDQELEHDAEWHRHDEQETFFLAGNW